MAQIRSPPRRMTDAVQVSEILERPARGFPEPEGALKENVLGLMAGVGHRIVDDFCTEIGDLLQRLDDCCQGRPGVLGDLEAVEGRDFDLLGYGNV